MGAKKIKISKKEVQKAQKAMELAKVPVLSKEWIEEHTNKILAGFGALLLLVGIIWGFNAYGTSKEQQARSEYAKILQTWPQDKTSDPQVWSQIITALETYLKEYSSSATANDAELDLATAYFQARQYENALKHNKKVFDQRSLDQGLKFPAQYQLALVYEALGRTDEALSQWQTLKTNEDSDLRKDVFWSMARLYAQQGDYAKAVENGELALKAPGGYPATPFIQAELVSLKLKMNPAANQ